MENLDNPVLESKGSMDESNSSFDLESMDPEQRQRVEEELKTELAKVSFTQDIVYICGYSNKYNFA